MAPPWPWAFAHGERGGCHDPCHATRSARRSAPLPSARAGVLVAPGAWLVAAGGGTVDTRGLAVEILVAAPSTPGSDAPGPGRTGTFTGAMGAGWR
ncbi:hypothetical protein CCP4SC76_2320018 [Gammaproteobacteria bacterium]